MNLKRWAERQGVSYATARRWFGDGLMPVPAREVGRLIPVDGGGGPAPCGVTAVCARVSSRARGPILTGRSRG